MFRVPSDIESLEPACTTPIGPLWMLGADSLELPGDSEYVVRCLRAPTSMLKVGAVLGMAASVETPNLAPATHWLRTDDGVWTATPRPVEAQPLFSCDWTRLSWEEAVEIWRPLVFAAQRVHSRGFVHGNFTPWSVWWDAEASRLVALDSGAWIADEIPAGSVWWTGTLHHSVQERRPTTADDVAALARLLLYLHLPAGQADQKLPNFEGVPAYAIPLIERALRCEVETTRELISGLSPSPIHGLPSRVKDDQATTVLFARVHGVEAVENERLGEGVRLWVTYPMYGESGEPLGYAPPQGAFFYRGAHGGVYESIKDVWDGAEINLIDAHVVQDSTGRSYLTARPETLPVIEPHWPVTVSSVIKAEGCASRYFVDVRDSGSSSRALVFGSVVHEVLEELVTSMEPAPIAEMIDKRVPRRRLGMLAAGLKDKDVPGFLTDAQLHIENMMAFTRARQGDERVGWRGQNAEVSRYSSIYGLEGRIDLVTEDERLGLHLVELKTGKTRNEHIGQVRAYKLLWDGVAEAQSIPISGFLLYSKEGRLLSTPLEDPLRERSLLRARNAVVAAHHAFAENQDSKLPFFMQAPRVCNAPACRFRKDRCRDQTQVLGLNPQDMGYGAWPGFDRDLVDRARQYWRHMVRLVELENWVENEAVGEILQSGRLREREQSFRAVRGLSLRHVDVGRGTVTFEGRNMPFGVGERVVVHQGDFHRSHILVGRIVESSATMAKLSARGAPNAESLPQDGWILDVLPARIGYRSAQQTLYRALASKRGPLLEVLLRPGLSEAQVMMTGDRGSSLSQVALDVLNDDQLEALATGVSSPLGCLIQGPPGTGKTTVIAYLVRELVKAGKRVLLAAQTNTAVDTMLQKLVGVDPEVEFLRLGSSSRCRGLARTLDDAGLDVQSRFSMDVGESSTSLEELATFLNTVPVMGCTTHGAARNDVIEFLKRSNERPFDVAIIDEATQITEPMTLAPMLLADRFVLVGDHRQLPPIVRNEMANSLAIDGWTTPLIDPSGPQLGLFGAAEMRSDAGLRGLDRSLFERLVDEGLPYVMLTEQYRMHQDIMAYSSGAFYGDQLVAHKSVANRTLELAHEPAGDLKAIISPAQPVVFSHVEFESEGRTNLAEATAVVETIEAILNASSTSPSIGVVSPFRAQVHLIRKLLNERDIVSPTMTIDVDTVERFQGSERDVVLVSLVKTGRTGEFLSDARRLNVTLTRARKKLIIFGHRACLELDPLFRAFIEHPRTHAIPWPKLMPEN